MTNIILRPKAVKFIKKADKVLKEKLKQELRSLSKDPFQNTKLAAPLSPLRSHHFTHQKTQYRMAYLVENNVIIILISIRENFYKKS